MKMKFKMLTKDLQCFDIFNTFVEEGPEEGEGVLAYSREEIRLPACEMMMLKYDFGIFEMMATGSLRSKARILHDQEENRIQQTHSLPQGFNFNNELRMEEDQDINHFNNEFQMEEGQDVNHIKGRHERSIDDSKKDQGIGIALRSWAIDDKG